MASTDTTYTCVDHFCVTSEPPEDKVPQRGAHLLDIDLRLPSHFTTSQKTDRALLKRVHTRLAGIATNDKGALLQNRIDAIRVNSSGPTRRMWTIFKDLNPRHLSIIAGFDEDCNFEPLRSMTTWNRLESIYLGGISAWGVFRLPPFVLRTLKTLDLHLCLDINLRAEGGAAPTLYLENLNLHTNDVGASAAMLLKNFPSIKRSLTHLAIHSINCGYDTARERTSIRRILTECNKLMDVKLTLRLYHAVDIPHFLPPNVQRLEFCGERSMAFLQLVDDWILRAKDPMWAPKLRFLRFTVDSEKVPMRDRFFLTKIRGEDDEDEDSQPHQTMEEWAASLPPGVIMTFPAPAENRELFDDHDSPTNDPSDIGFDADPEALQYIRTFHSQEDDDDLDEIDLDNLPGIGPHPNHVLKKNKMIGILANGEMVEDGEASYKRIMKANSVEEEVLAKFELAFAVKKQELFKVLRDTRPGIELV